MLTATSVNATVERFPIPSLPKCMGKTDYATIKEVHQLLTANVSLVESELGEGQNGYLGLIFPPEQYAHISGTAFIIPPKPGEWHIS